MSQLICSATLGDIPDIDRIEQEAFNTPWNREMIRAAILNFQYDVRILRMAEGRVAGFYIAHTHQLASNLDNLAVDVPLRCLGYGHDLLHHWIAAARSQSLTQLSLQVNTRNKGAQKLYREFQFRAIRLLHRYYPDGQDAYQMERGLDSLPLGRGRAVVGWPRLAAGESRQA